VWLWQNLHLVFGPEKMTILQAHLAIDHYQRLVDQFQSDPESIDGGELAGELNEIRAEHPELTIDILSMLSTLSWCSRRVETGESGDPDEWEGMTLNDLLGG